MFEQIVEQLAVVAVFAKRLIDLLKPAYQNLPYQASVDRVLVLAVSIGLAVAWHLNLLEAAGLVLSPVVGEVVTGFVASLGAEVVNEVIALLKMFRDKTV
jgi:hypothetical protein